MRLSSVRLVNFRRFKDVCIEVGERETLFAGPNNSGKTSVISGFKVFVSGQDFKIYDFNVYSMDGFSEAYAKRDVALIPESYIELGFDLNCEEDGGRVFGLLTRIPVPDNRGVIRVGLRISLEVKNFDKLVCEYEKVPKEDRKTLSQFLGFPAHMKRHFVLKYYKIDFEGEGEDRLISLPPDEARRLLSSIIRVDYVDAQRNMDDQEISRGNRLSAVFSEFYRNNLEELEGSEEAKRVLEHNNTSLTAHYGKQFDPIMRVIERLGVPSVKDRQLRIVSSLVPESLLRGGTTLLYVDQDLGHELPEAYNGLGFKNLLFMSLQVSNCYYQWFNTKVDRPLCHVILIEEPEVHLHSQVQQVFIKNIWEVVAGLVNGEDEREPEVPGGEVFESRDLRDISSENGVKEKEIPRQQGVEEGSKRVVSHKSGIPTQFIISTHSSHILDAVDFEKVRYFKRCNLPGAKNSNISEVNSLVWLKGEETKNDLLKREGSSRKNKELIKRIGSEERHFLLKYFKLNHCDLFFADAAILVEGATERMLLPSMIEKVSPELKSCYLSVLEVGGAFAHYFAGVMEFLGLPYVVITDIDSVLPSDQNKKCKPSKDGALTSNQSLRFFLKEKVVQRLCFVEEEKCGKVRVYEKDKGLGVGCLEQNRCVVYQMPYVVEKLKDNSVYDYRLARTFEEDFVYANAEKIWSGRLSPYDADTFVKFDDVKDTYSVIQSDSFKKTEFALRILTSDFEWEVPRYIEDGIHWLEKKLGIGGNK